MVVFKSVFVPYISRKKKVFFSSINGLFCGFQVPFEKFSTSCNGHLISSIITTEMEALDFNIEKKNLTKR